jgi:hypothetical protein
MATRVDNDKNTAQESEKTKKAREKLKSRLKKIDTMVTSQAIDEKKRSNSRLDFPTLLVQRRSE